MSADEMADDCEVLVDAPDEDVVVAACGDAVVVVELEDPEIDVAEDCSRSNCCT